MQLHVTDDIDKNNLIFTVHQNNILLLESVFSIRFLHLEHLEQLKCQLHIQFLIAFLL